MEKRKYEMKRKTGHLIIHGVTNKDAEKINEFLIDSKMEREADWWPDVEMEQFDNAAVAAILSSRTHSKKLPKSSHFRLAEGIVHYGGKQGADSN